MELSSPVDGVLPDIERFVPHEHLHRPVAPLDQPRVGLSDRHAVLAHLRSEVVSLVAPPDDVGRELELVCFLL